MPQLLKGVDIVFGNERDAEHLFDIPLPKNESELQCLLCYAFPFCDLSAGVKVGGANL